MVAGMKKIVLLLWIAFIMISITGCRKIDDAKEDISSEDRKETEPQEMTETEGYTLSDFYPFLDNTLYTYQGKGNEYASFTTSVDFFDETRAQIRKKDEGTEKVDVIEVNEGRIVRILSREECHYRENFLSKEPEMSDILLMEPLVKGTKWSAPDGSRRYISGVNVKVVTPAGDFDAVEVITESADAKKIDYYAAGIGLVKTVWESQEGDIISSTLEQVTMNQPLIQRIRFFYPNSNADKLYYIDKDVNYNTNDQTTIVLGDVFKDLPKGDVARVLTENVTINWLHLNEDRRLSVDFSRELLSEMNAGTGYESLILVSITNTLGSYYDVEKVFITVEGSPYSSGHIIMDEADAFLVATKDALPLPTPE